MSTEQSQIMGFFIEESRDRLGTIERGLLDLGGTLDDSEMLDEVFRAAHSVKGGAAMLGLSAIQTVSHRLEDCLKTLKENPIAADSHLESLFLRVFDSLQELLDRLQSPDGLSDDDSARVLNEIEPVCQDLTQYIDSLAQGRAVPPETAKASAQAADLPATSPISTQSEEENALSLIVGSDVLARLREMLQLFKQPDTPDTRRSLQRLCRLLKQVGEQFDLENWQHLIETVSAAIARPENTFPVLASVSIKEIKQAQELILANRESEITPSPRLLALLPQAEPEPQPEPQPQPEPARAETPKTRRPKADRPGRGPQVGTAELSSLADLFEGENGENDDLEDWNEDDPAESLDFEADDSGDDNDFSDLFDDDTDAADDPAASSNDDLFDDDLFGDAGDRDTTQDADEDDTGLDALLDAVENGNHPARRPAESGDDDDDLQDLLDIGLDDDGEAADEPVAEADAAADSPADSPADSGDDDLDWLGLDADDSDDEDAARDKTLSLGDDSAAELEALFGSSPNAGSNPDSGGDDLDDLFGAGDIGDLDLSADGDALDFDFDGSDDDAEALDDLGDFNLDPEPSAARRETSEDADDFDLGFDLGFDDIEEEPAADASAEDADELGDFDLGFDDIEEEPAADASAEDADELGDFDLGFDDIEEEPAADASAEDADELGDFDLGFDDIEEEPAADASAEDADELGDFDLGFDLDEEEEPAAESADEFELDFDLGEEPSDAPDDADDLGDFDLSFDLDEEEETAAESADEFELDFDLDAELETRLDTDEEETELSLDDLLGDADGEASSGGDGIDLDDLFDESEDEGAIEDAEPAEAPVEFVRDFPELEVLTSIDPQFLGDDGFDALAAYLDRDRPAPAATSDSSSDDESFDDLMDLLEVEPASPKPPVTQPSRSTTSSTSRSKRASRPAFEQTMRVPIKQLDNLSNLVGELVVNRNSLEQDQERLRQFLDNLLHQVSQLTEVGQRMQDLYERTLLEMALLASRQSRKLAAQGHAPANHGEDGEYDALEMDRFTAFHEHAQDIIELVVRVRESSSDIEFLVDENDQVTRQLRQVTTQLQEGLTRSRMVPFANAADRLPRGVRDNALKFGKQVNLQVEGRDTLIDRMILEHLTDPLTHLVNNAIAHGIESPEEREAKGKPPTGQISVSTFHQGNQTIITIADDGAGINTETVKAKAVQKGLVAPERAKAMSNLEVYDLLFLPGLSTREKADDLAGRGVGMDVVKTKLNEIRGAIGTDSTLGKGTTFTIRLPLTLSISKALCCISDHAPIAFPMDGVGEVLDNLPCDRIVTESDGRAFVQWRDQRVPYQPLRELFTYNRISRRSQMYGANSEDDTISVVVLRSAGSYLAISVDQIVGEQEIVIKQLEGPIPKPTGITGATVMGDGRIVPIADVLELIDLSMGRVRHDSGTLLWDDRPELEAADLPAEKAEPLVLIVDDSITVRELLSMTFKKSGYRVEQARDGQEAWEKLRSGMPCELVFCDMEMPRMNGMELLERMHNDEYLADLPIAMLTSRTAEKMKKKAAELGARGYFTKPYLEEVLLDAAQRMLDGEVLMAPSEEATQDA